MAKPKRVLLLLGYYVREIHHGVVVYAHEQGWILDASMAHFGQVPTDWHGDGIIAFSNRPDIISKVRAEQVPTVDLFNGREALGLPRVLIDNEAIGRMAGDYLVAQGFQNIGYFFYDPMLANPDNERERAAGLRQVVEAAGRRFHTIQFDQCISQIRKLPRPLAIMAQNDLVGDYLIHKLQDAKIRIPHEVAVIGVDTDELYRTLSPVPQTSVDSNVEYQGYVAAKLLDQMMQGKPAPPHPIMIPPSRVVERESTSMLASEHPATNKAVTFIHEHFHEGIDVETIARHVGLSRHQLNKVFSKHVGEAVSSYLLRIKINAACEQLAKTNEKIEGLATDLGFGSATYFSTVFRQKTGLTPAEFRHRARIRDRW